MNLWTETAPDWIFGLRKTVSDRGEKREKATVRVTRNQSNTQLEREREHTVRDTETGRGTRPIRIFCRQVSITVFTRGQLSRLTDSIPEHASLSYLTGLVQYSPAYLFLLISKYGQNTFSNSSLIGVKNVSDTSAAASYLDKLTQMKLWTENTPNNEFCGVRVRLVPEIHCLLDGFHTEFDHH